jgi:transposase
MRSAGRCSHIIRGLARPSVDPELIIRMLMIGYAFGIRSERRLGAEVHLNLAYRWFCGLGLISPVPDRCIVFVGLAVRTDGFPPKRI